MRAKIIGEAAGSGRFRAKEAFARHHGTPAGSYADLGAADPAEGIRPQDRFEGLPRLLRVFRPEAGQAVPQTLHLDKIEAEDQAGLAGFRQQVFR
jgi:hypothetical protein